MCNLSLLFRVEDHDDVFRIIEEETKLQLFKNRPDFLVQLIEVQNEKHHSAVCEVCFSSFLL